MLGNKTKRILVGAVLRIRSQDARLPCVSARLILTEGPVKSKVRAI